MPAPIISKLRVYQKCRLLPMPKEGYTKNASTDRLYCIAAEPSATWFIGG